MDKRSKIGINIDPELHKQLKVKAALQDKSITDVIVSAIKEYLNPTKK